MFVPSVSRPTRQTVEKEIQKVYPDSKVLSFLPKEFDPANPTVMVGEGVMMDQAVNEIKNMGDSPLTRKLLSGLAKNPKDLKKAVDKKDPVGEKMIKKAKTDKPGVRAAARDIRKDELRKAAKQDAQDDMRSDFKEENINEDDMKGMSVKSGHKRPTKSGAGMTAKGVAAYRRRNPGSKLKTAVTGKVKKGSKDAKRRKSYCARSAGQMKKFPKAAKDPNSRLRQARRRWKC